MNIDIDISNVIIVTKRLVLRPWRLSDLDDLFEYARVDGVGQMAGWSPHKDKEESLAILNMFIEGEKTFALEYRGKVIGSLGIEKYNEKRFPEYAEYRCRELGFVLSKDFWGQGLIPEAVEEVKKAAEASAEVVRNADSEISAAENSKRAPERSRTASTTY